MSLFHDAARDSDLLLLRRAGKRDCNRPDDNGLTPLHWAAWKGNVEAAKLLVSKGADVTLLDHGGHTPFHVAAQYGSTAVLRYLVNSCSVNIWAMNDDGYTACDLAAQREHQAAFRFLENAQLSQTMQHTASTDKAKQKAEREHVKRLTAKRKAQQPELQSGTASKKKLKEVGRRLKSASSSAEVRGDSKEASRGRILSHGQETGQTGQVSVLRAKFGMKSSRSADSAAALGHLGFGTADLPTSGATSRTADTIQRLQKLGGFNATLGSSSKGLARTLQSLESDSDVRSTKSESKGMKKRSVSTSILQRDSFGGSNPLMRTTKLMTDKKQTAKETTQTDLSAFLHVLDLADLKIVFEEENIDLEALMICTDRDLRDLDIGLGPRRKILASIKQRQATLTKPGRLKDSSV